MSTDEERAATLRQPRQLAFARTRRGDGPLTHVRQPDIMGEFMRATAALPLDVRDDDAVQAFAVWAFRLLVLTFPSRGSLARVARRYELQHERCVLPGQRQAFETERLEDLHEFIEADAELVTSYAAFWHNPSCFVGLGISADGHCTVECVLKAVYSRPERGTWQLPVRDLTPWQARRAICLSLLHLLLSDVVVHADEPYARVCDNLVTDIRAWRSTPPASAIVADYPFMLNNIPENERDARLFAFGAEVSVDEVPMVLTFARLVHVGFHAPRGAPVELQPHPCLPRADKTAIAAFRAALARFAAERDGDSNSPFASDTPSPRNSHAPRHAPRNTHHTTSAPRHSQHTTSAPRNTHHTTSASRTHARKSLPLRAHV